MQEMLEPDEGHGDEGSRDRPDGAKMLRSCGWCSRVGMLGRESRPWRLLNSWLGQESLREK